MSNKEDINYTLLKMAVDALLKFYYEESTEDGGTDWDKLNDEMYHLYQVRNKKFLPEVQSK